MSTAQSPTRVLTLILPKSVVDSVERTASEEHRDVGELFRDAFRTYKADQLERKLASLRPPLKPGEIIPSDEDIEAMIDEVRSEREQQRLIG